ncbi:hypothetical protein JCM8547_007345 [Rhodosporidiobolus lusitaniae]
MTVDQVAGSVASDWWLNEEIADSFVRTSVAPLVIGTLLSCVLCGVVLTLAGQYYYFFGRDRLAFRVPVFVATSLAVADTVIDIRWTLLWSVDGFGDVKKIGEGRPTLFALFSLILLLEVVGCESTRARFLVAFICGGMLASLGMGIYLCHHYFLMSRLIDFLQPWPVMVSVVANTMATDLAITTGLCYYLTWQRRENKGLLTGDSRLKQVVLHSVRVNVVASIVQLAQLTLLFTELGIYFVIIGLLVPKISEPL